MAVSCSAWGLSLIVWLAPLQLLLGDMHGLNSLKYQPAKIAALEAHWNTGTEVPLILFAIPDPKAETNHFEIAIPRLGSLILTHDWNGEIKGLKSFLPEDRPNPIIPFFAFRIMVGIGMIMIVLGLTGAVLWFRGGLIRTAYSSKAMQYAAPLGFLAVLSGWFVAEVGRQPWTVVRPVAHRGLPCRPYPPAAYSSHWRYSCSLMASCSARASITSPSWCVPGLTQPRRSSAEGDPSRRPMEAAGNP